MILQALKEYYDRKVADSDSSIAPAGWELKEIPFIICLDNNGRAINVEDTRENGKAKKFLVPHSLSRSGRKSYETTFVLWDHIGYVLGKPDNDPKSAQQHEVWKKSIHNISENIPQSESVKSIEKFYAHGNYEAAIKSDLFKSCISTKPVPNVSFRVNGSIVFDDSDVENYVNSVAGAVQEDGRVCMICGERGSIARIHSDTRIGKDAKKLVGFQKNSGYDSYGKIQAYNAPVCIKSEFAYTTALNTLLKSKQKIYIGSATTVFWSAKRTEFEDRFADFWSDPPPDNPDKLTSVVKALYESVGSGAFVTDSDNTRFYVLGLSPNNARIAVRFWHIATVSELAQRFREYFKDLKIAHRFNDKDDLPMRCLLRSLVRKPSDIRKWDEQIPQRIVGDTMRSILEGLPLPETLLQAAILRVKAEREVTYSRAKLIKGCLNRKFRANPKTNERSLTVSLDKENTDIGYRLGRLFATLEKIQQEANPGINATIRDKFYASMSSTPRMVFGNLMCLKNHHLSKLKSTGRRIHFENLLGEIIWESPTELPAHLDLNEQGKFAIGYYHQIRDLFTKKSDGKTTDASSQTTTND
jgi:CRISPR-associated protein Csd1